MAIPRLTGRRLAAVRALSGTPFVRALRALAMRDYGVGTLLDLPADTRYIVEVVPYPVRGAPPRAFGQGGLPAPEPGPDPFAATPDTDDPVHAWQPDRDTAPAAWRAALGRGVRGARLGIVRRDWEDCDPCLAAAALHAVDALVREGATLVDVDVPLAPLANAIGMLVIGPEAAANLSDDLAVHGPRISDDLRLVLRLLSTMSSHEVATAARTRAMLRRQLAAALAGVDALVMPTLAVPAPRYPLHEDGVCVSDPDAIRGLCRYAFLGNLTGLPAGTVPVGLVDGLPAGLQFLGDAWDEATVIALMAHVERLGVGRLPRAPGWESPIA